METILLLNGILPTLSPSSIVKSLFQPAKSSRLSLPTLLSLVPLTPSWSIADDDRRSFQAHDLDQYVDYHRSHVLFSELCRLIVSSSMIAGPSAACDEYVLPSLDAFFATFVEVFGTVPIESVTMGKAIELGAELFLPPGSVCRTRVIHSTPQCPASTLGSR